MARSHSWIYGAATLALMAAATSAFAQAPVDQTVTNSGAVTVAPANQTITIPGAISGPGASATVSATGAAAVTSIAGINVVFPANLGAVTQSATNTAGGTVTAPGSATYNIGNTGSPWTSLSGAGTSASVSSTGAVSSTSVTGVSAAATPTAYTAFTIESVEQTTTNSGNVQTGTSSADRGRILLQAVPLSGAGASASVSATGAASGVSSTLINAAAANTSTGYITQTTQTTGGTTSNFGAISTASNPQGPGVSLSVSATGAISSVAGTVIGSTGSVSTGFAVGGTIVQDTSAAGTTTNLGSVSLLGQGSSVAGPPAGFTASVSATGAASAVSATAINAVSPVFAAGNIEQTTTKSGATAVTNTGTIDSQPNISGTGASVAISATGAISSVSVTAIGTSGTAAGFTFGNINQGTETHGSVTNTSTQFAIANQADGNIPAILGSGASASISASGAASVISGTFIATGANGYNLGIGDVESTADNFATVTNNNGTLNLIQGGITGPGASASVSASGATVALSVTSIANPAGSITAGSVIQNATNQAGSTIINNGGTILLGDGAFDTRPGVIAGPGASASISASGAVASLGVTSINDTGSITTAITSINQTATNLASVTNTGTISLVNGGISGPGASASVSAVGAGAYVSFSAIRGVP